MHQYHKTIKLPQIFSIFLSLITSLFLILSNTALVLPILAQTSGVTNLGGMNLNGYCANINQGEATVTNGIWYCSKQPLRPINLYAECDWQYAMTNAYAAQLRPGDQYSWACFSSPTMVTNAQPVDGKQQNGAEISPTSSNDLSSATFQQSMTNLRSTGANYVTIDIPLIQANTSTSAITTTSTTPTDASLIFAINYAHSIGLHVVLKPMLDVATGEWRAFINPSNKATWFANYTSFLDHYAQIAQQTATEEICLGTELASVSEYTVDPANTTYWDNLIVNVRQVFTGNLTYSANWGNSSFYGEMNYINFWDKLDFIGISAYFTLTNQADPSVSNLEAAWQYWGSLLNNIHSQWNKPIVFAETGYRSVSGANEEPYNDQWQGSPDEPEQATDLQALFAFWSSYDSWMIGYEIVGWQTNPNVGNWQDTLYTPQNKMAQDTMTDWFTSKSFPSYAFNVTSTSHTPSTVSVNQQVTITTTVSDTASIAHGMIVDIVINNAQGQAIFQKFYPDQAFAANGSQTYSVPWTPSASGTYTVNVGVFNSNWSSNYLWNGNADTITVQ